MGGEKDIKAGSWRDGFLAGPVDVNKFSRRRLSPGIAYKCRNLHRQLPTLAEIGEAAEQFPRLDFSIRNGRLHVGSFSPSSPLGGQVGREGLSVMHLLPIEFSPDTHRVGGVGGERLLRLPIDTTPPHSSEDYEDSDFDDMALTDEEITGKSASEVRAELKGIRRLGRG